MKIIKYLLLGFIALIIVLGVVGIFLPDTQHVERQIAIDAPADEIFPYVNDFRKFNEWSPWAKIDPQTKYTFSGPESGVGAKMEWASEHQQVGQGTQEILESVPNNTVKTRLDFGMGGPSLAGFALSENNGQTTVVWSFDAYFENSIARYFGLMLDLDKWVGGDYEKGLANLKTVVEAK